MKMGRKINAYNASLGMQVYHERRIDWDAMTLVHHIELAASGYKLTENGPELINIEDFELDDDEE